MDVLKIGVLKEPEGEQRVSMTPEIVEGLKKLPVTILIEHGAGEKAFYSDQEFLEKGAKLVDRAEIITDADLILSIHRPDFETIKKTKLNSVWIGVYQPLFHVDIMHEWNALGQTVFSMDTLPRTTRAQSMDVLSSQANIAGYKAVVLAASEYSRYFPMLMTAAGSIPPAKVLILGAGVAGLQAIATAKRLGAVVEVFDTRPAVKEEVLSLGAKFVEVDGAKDASQAGGYAVEQDEDFQRRQKEKIAEHAKKSDIIITTAQIPGKKAPILITKEMISTMRSGSVIIDLAASTGGNTEYTKNNETLIEYGVKIIGNSNLFSLAAADASRLYAKNVFNFIKLLINERGELNLNFEDDLIKGTCIFHRHEMVYERIKR
jgi:NAD(P) transhydrogenase subunit alpha